MLRVAIVGASGYAGGELLRLLSCHPRVRVVAASSRGHAGEPVAMVHPHLRGAGSLRELVFCAPADVPECDLLFLCLPHGEAAAQIEKWSRLAPRLIDLSADFRLSDMASYERWYGQPHPNQAWARRFVYGLPETRRERLRTATHVSGVGCNATAVNLALLPLARAGLIRSAVCDVKVGSSEAGSSPSPTGHHPERSGRVRPFALTQHRHQAEVMQESGQFDLRMSVTSVELVRGVQCTAHVFPVRPLEEKEIWKLYRSAFASEPFTRLVKSKAGMHRFPEPRLLAGTNYCDVGFDAEPASEGQRVVIVSAMDNLVKGAAGSAVQCMNLMIGAREEEGLEFGGLYP
jgi:N-acetyl-gamma-glutamyl-phosphate/LysW-gamma-L-alpha-aminoadipyl-6-phosphate reductase